jgi:hypothetical protein
MRRKWLQQTKQRLTLTVVVPTSSASSCCDHLRSIRAARNKVLTGNFRPFFTATFLKYTCALFAGRKRKYRYTRSYQIKTVMSIRA